MYNWAKVIGGGVANVLKFLVVWNIKIEKRSCQRLKILSNLDILSSLE